MFRCGICPDWNRLLSRVIHLSQRYADAMRHHNEGQSDVRSQIA